MHVVCILGVFHFNSLIVHQPISSWLDHACDDEWTIPLRWELSFFVRMMDEDQVTWANVLSDYLLVPPRICFCMVLVEVVGGVKPRCFDHFDLNIPLYWCCGFYLRLK